MRAELQFGDVGFCEGRETGESGENPLSKARTNNKLKPHDQTGIKPWPYWWEASALGTAP